MLFSRKCETPLSGSSFLQNRTWCWNNTEKKNTLCLHFVTATEPEPTVEGNLSVASSVKPSPEGWKIWTAVSGLLFSWFHLQTFMLLFKHRLLKCTFSKTGSFVHSHHKTCNPWQLRWSVPYMSDSYQHTAVSFIRLYWCGKSGPITAVCRNHGQFCEWIFHRVVGHIKISTFYYSHLLPVLNEVIHAEVITGRGF